MQSLNWVPLALESSFNMCWKYMTGKLDIYPRELLCWLHCWWILRQSPALTSTKPTQLCLKHTPSPAMQTKKQTKSALAKSLSIFIIIIWIGWQMRVLKVPRISPTLGLEMTSDGVWQPLAPMKGAPRATRAAGRRKHGPWRADHSWIQVSLKLEGTIKLVASSPSFAHQHRVCSQSHASESSHQTP